MDLPSNEYTFNLDETGERTKRRFDGSFTVKCLLTIDEIVDVGLRMDAYNRGSTSVMPGIQLLNRARAELEVRIQKSPSWWRDSNNGRDLMDTNIILEVFNKALDAEKVYDERIASVSKGAEEVLEKSASKKSAKQASG